MKKRLFKLFAITGLSAFALAACSNTKIDTARIRDAMSSLDAGEKGILEQGLTDIDAGKYKDAIPYLRKVAFTTKLTADQNKLIKDTIDKLQKKVAKGE